MENSNLLLVWEALEGLRQLASFNQSVPAHLTLPYWASEAHYKSHIFK